MAEQTATAAPELETPARDWSGLDEAIGDIPETPVVEPPKSSAVPVAEPKVETPATPAPEPTTDELKNLDALIEGIDKAAEPEPKPTTESPATPEVEAVQTWSKSPEIAQRAVAAVQQMVNLDKAASAGDFNQFFTHFAPQFQNALVDYIFQQNKEKFAQRFVDEIEGAPKADPRIDALQRQLAEVSGKLTDREKREIDFQQRQATVQRSQAYDKWWIDLFAAVNVTDADDKLFLQGAVMNALSRDPKAAQNIRAGRLGDIGKKFREIYPRFKDRQKAGITATSELRNQQEQQSKIGQLATTSAAATTTAEPPDHDEDGKRTKSFWERNLAKLGLDK